jgi:hypothetical protein
VNGAEFQCQQPDFIAKLLEEMRFNFMNKGKSLSTMTLIAIIVGAIIILPWILSMAGMRAGFVDIGPQVSFVPSAPQADRTSNSEFLPCRSVGGKPCDEGYFCDGYSKSCVPIAQPGV